MDGHPMRITQAFTFEAAHHLPMVPDGHRCKRVHGHSYRTELTFAGEVDARGFVIDFFEVEATVGPVIAGLDHCLLNEVDGLENPTAENIAAWLFGHVSARLPQLVNVRLYETPMCWADCVGRRE
jgi:6-pyruvoyltetrahydropterin/6-carboxytetrahydropterin synthase